MLVDFLCHLCGLFVRHPGPVGRAIKVCFIFSWYFVEGSLDITLTFFQATYWLTENSALAQGGFEIVCWLYLGWILARWSKIYWWLMTWRPLLSRKEFTMSQAWVLAQRGSCMKEWLYPQVWLELKLGAWSSRRDISSNLQSLSFTEVCVGWWGWAEW